MKKFWQGSVRKLIEPSKDSKVRDLKKKLVELQASVDILLGPTTTVGYTQGNPYPDYKNAVKQLAQAYEGTARWGVQQVGNIIDIRSAFIIGQGIKLKVEDQNADASREMKFLEEFVRINNLDEEMPQELAKEAEIEGRSLVRLVPSSRTPKQFEIRHVAWSSTEYVIVTKPEDYDHYLEAKYKDKNTSSEIRVPEEDFVYKKFSGRVSKVNDLMPKTAKVLRHCEDLDKALWDWRQGNNLFGIPTPYFKVEKATEVDPLLRALQAQRWKIGQAFVGTADFKFVSPSSDGVVSLEKEITTLVKIVSGATGVPVHFLGYPDLMSNRSTSTDLFEFINASVNKERKIWAGFYEELFDKALLKAGQNFKPGLVKAEIVSFTEAQLRLLTEIWLPLYTAGVIDLNFFLAKIPDINPEDVLNEQEERAKKLMESLKREEEEAKKRALNGNEGEGEDETED